MSKFLSKIRVWLPIFCLIAVGVGVYSFNLNNELFWDDQEWIINNVFVHDISWANIKFWLTHNTLAGVGLKSNYYRPFLFFTFALNYMMAGIKPLVYHLTSNLIHIFNGILVFWLISRVFKRKLLAFLVAILFLIHPLQTEAITYISGRGDSLVAMFMLLSLILFHRAEVKNEGWLGVNKILSVIFLVLGLLSRETGIIFPVLALAFYVSVLSPNHPAKAEATGQASERFVESVKWGLVKTWPYFAVVITYGILRLTVLNFLNTLNFYLESDIYSENLDVRIFTFLPILWEYLKLLIVPVGLHMERGGIVYTSLFQWPVWPVFLGLTGLLVWLRHLYKKALIFKLKAENYQVWLLGVSWFFIALGPVSGITPINAVMYEHWLYLPMVGFWLIVFFYLVKLFDYLKSKSLNAYSLTLTAVLVIYLSFLGYQSIRRNIVWGKQAEFYKDILKYEPDSARINNNLGNFYYNQGEKEQAEFYYRKAVESGDAFAQPYYNLGSILQSKGDIFGAMQLYEKAIKINPNLYYPYQNLAVIYAQQGNLTKAVENIEMLKSLIPNNPRVYYNSALIYIALKDRGQALKDLQTGLKYADLDPETGELIKELIKELQKRKI